MKHLLIIEDDATFSASLVRSLSRRGYGCTIAATINEAREIAVQNKPQFILMDLNLGRENAQDYVYELRLTLPQSCIVILTGNGSIPSAVAAIKDGADAYLTKPTTPDAIDKALSDALRKTSSRSDLWELEQDHILKVLNECSGNISEAARKLGLHRRTLQRRLKKT